METPEFTITTVVDPLAPGAGITAPPMGSVDPLATPKYGGPNPKDARSVTFVGYGSVTGDHNHLREEIGNLWTIKGGHGTDQYLYPQNLPTYKTENLNGITVYRAKSNSPYIRAVEINPCTVKIYDPDLAVPNYLIPVRLYSELNVPGGDVTWNTLFRGGELGDKTFTGLLPTNTMYYNTMFKYAIPYTVLELKKSNIPQGKRPPANMSYKYKEYLRSYEREAQLLDSELLIPNYYTYKYLKYADKEYKRYATLNNAVSATGITNRVFGDSISAYNYLDKEFVNYKPDEVLKSEVENSQKNIIFDNTYFKRERHRIGAASEGKNNFPYFVNFSFPPDTGLRVPSGAPVGTTKKSYFPVRDSIAKHDFSSKFLEILKDVYDETFPGITPHEENFTVEVASLTGSQHIGKRKAEGPINTTSVVKNSYKSLDFLEFLTMIYNNYSASLNDNYSFVGHRKDAHGATYSATGFDRYFNNKNTMAVIDDVIKYSKKILNKDELKYMNLQHVINLQQNPTETLAYRIKKTAGSPGPEGDSKEVLQNFWFFNSTSKVAEGLTADPEDLEFIDTQVKYGQKYTYDLYAYVLVPSYRYKYSNLRLTKQIARIDTDGDGMTDLYCMQFYDAPSNNFAAQLFYDNGTRGPTAPPWAGYGPTKPELSGWVPFDTPFDVGPLETAPFSPGGSSGGTTTTWTPPVPSATTVPISPAGGGSSGGGSYGPATPMSFISGDPDSVPMGSFLSTFGPTGRGPIMGGTTFESIGPSPGSFIAGTRQRAVLAAGLERASSGGRGTSGVDIDWDSVQQMDHESGAGFEMDLMSTRTVEGDWLCWNMENDKCFVPDSNYPPIYSTDPRLDGTAWEDVPGYWANCCELTDPPIWCVEGSGTGSPDTDGYGYGSGTSGLGTGGGGSAPGYGPGESGDDNYSVEAGAGGSSLGAFLGEMIGVPIYQYDDGRSLQGTGQGHVSSAHADYYNQHRAGMDPAEGGWWDTSDSGGGSYNSGEASAEGGYNDQVEDHNEEYGSKYDMDTVPVDPVTGEDSRDFDYDGFVNPGDEMDDDADAESEPESDPYVDSQAYEDWLAQQRLKAELSTIINPGGPPSKIDEWLDIINKSEGWDGTPRWSDPVGPGKGWRDIGGLYEDTTGLWPGVKGVYGSDPSENTGLDYAIDIVGLAMDAYGILKAGQSFIDSIHGNESADTSGNKIIDVSFGVVGTVDGNPYYGTKIKIGGKKKKKSHKTKNKPGGNGSNFNRAAPVMPQQWAQQILADPSTAALASHALVRMPGPLRGPFGGLKLDGTYDAVPTSGEGWSVTPTTADFSSPGGATMTTTPFGGGGGPPSFGATIPVSPFMPYPMPPLSPEIAPPITSLLPTCRESIISTSNPDSTIQQDLSISPHLADFYMHIEPCFKLIEIPVFSKTQMVLDHPANRASIYPFQYLDDSQRLGYEVSYESHVPGPFPTVVTPSDQVLKDNYLFANNKLSQDEISNKSVSRARYIEVYRLKSKPTKFTDFDGHLIKTIDLQVEDTDYVYSDTIYESEVDINQKYYYLFRFLNEHFVISKPSEILECELVEDGGYKYAVFGVMYEEQLQKARPKNTNIQMKKLLQIQPNVSQLMMVTDQVNFNRPAGSQVNKVRVGAAEHLIWGKTFKIRLTSKKTGRKLDLNIGFKIQQDPEPPPRSIPPAALDPDSEDKPHTPEDFLTTDWELVPMPGLDLIDPGDFSVTTPGIPAGDAEDGLPDLIPPDEWGGPSTPDGWVIEVPSESSGWEMEASPWWDDSPGDTASYFDPDPSYEPTASFVGPDSGPPSASDVIPDYAGGTSWSSDSWITTAIDPWHIDDDTTVDGPAAAVDYPWWFGN